jgi:hypothetical protein
MALVPAAFVAGPTGASVWLRDIDAPVTREAQRIEGTQGALWAEDGTIVFQPINAALAWGGHLMRVSARGGTPEALTALSDGKSHSVGRRHSPAATRCCSRATSARRRDTRMPR